MYKFISVNRGFMYNGQSTYNKCNIILVSFVSVIVLQNLKKKPEMKIFLLCGHLLQNTTKTEELFTFEFCS